MNVQCYSDTCMPKSTAYPMSVTLLSLREKEKIMSKIAATAMTAVELHCQELVITLDASGLCLSRLISLHYYTSIIVCHGQKQVYTFIVKLTRRQWTSVMQTSRFA